MSEKKDIEFADASAADLIDDDDVDTGSVQGSGVPHSPRWLKLASMAVLLGVYVLILVLAITQNKYQCKSGLDKVCTDFPASYWYCAVEENGQLKVVPDGYSQNNVTCAVDNQNCCVDNVLIKDDKVVIGVLFGILAFIFGTANSGYWILDKFYAIVPSLFLCYFMPGILGSFGVFIGHDSALGGVASSYFLPACLGLLCLNVDIPGVAKLGPKAIIMFLAGTAGVVLGGPFAVWFFGLVWPEVVCGDETWRGLSYISGSWIGGGANAVAMVGIFEPSADAQSQAVAVDVFVANIWMAVLFVMISMEDKINKLIRADNTGVEALKSKMMQLEQERARITTGLDLFNIACVSWICCGFSNYAAATLAKLFKSFGSTVITYMALDSATLWRVVIATIFGLVFSFTPMKNIEGAGASKVANVYLYFLVLTIGMGMDITAIARNPGIFLVGGVWMLIHALTMIIVAIIIKAPLFFFCVGSQANIGGAASAPVIAAQFHTSLAPVGAIFAVFGYIVGTFGGWACSMMMQMAAPPCEA